MTKTTAYKRVVPRPVLKLLAAVLITGTIAGSFLPGSEKRRLGTEPIHSIPHHIALQHRLYHLATFGSLTLVVLMLAYGIRGEVTGALSVLALGCTIEGTQYFIGFSDALEWWDVRDDLYAVSAAFVLIQIANAAAEAASSRVSNRPG